MKIITVLNRKGGIGKTTTAQALYEGLKKRGYRILALDLDQQANFTDSILKGKKPSYTVNDLLNNKDLSNLTASNIIGATMELTQLNLSELDIYALRDALKPLNKFYDLVIIDTPPSINQLTISALAFTNYLILPSDIDKYSAKGINEILSNVVRKIKQDYNSELVVSGVLIVKYNPRIILHSQLRGLLEKVAKAHNTKVFNTTIRESVAIREARTIDSELLNYNGGKSNAQRDYKAFIKEFIESEKLWAQTIL